MEEAALGIRLVLSDGQWERIAPRIIGDERTRGSSGRDNRLFVEAVLWLVRTGVPWRDLPEDFGPWNSVFRRFSRWSRKGVWWRIFEAMSDDPGLRVPDRRLHHRPRPPARLRGGKGGSEDQAIGRSRGGLSTKIHMAVRGLGCPVRFALRQRVRDQPLWESPFGVRSRGR